MSSWSSELNCTYSTFLWLRLLLCWWCAMSFPWFNDSWSFFYGPAGYIATVSHYLHCMVLPNRREGEKGTGLCSLCKLVSLSFFHFQTVLTVCWNRSIIVIILLLSCPISFFSHRHTESDNTNGEFKVGTVYHPLISILVLDCAYCSAVNTFHPCISCEISWTNGSYRFFFWRIWLSK